MRPLAHAFTAKAKCLPALNAAARGFLRSGLHFAGGNITAAAKPRRRDCGTDGEAAARVAKIAPNHRTAVGQVRLRRAELVKAKPGWLAFAHQKADDMKTPEIDLCQDADGLKLQIGQALIALTLLENEARGEMRQSVLLEIIAQQRSNIEALADAPMF